MPNGDGLARGILQAGQAIGQGIQQRGQVRAQRQMMIQQQLLQQQEKLNKDFDRWINIAGNDKFDDVTRKAAYNNAAAVGNQLGVKMPAIDEVDQATKGALKSIGAVVNDLQMGKVDRPQAFQNIQFITTTAVQEAASAAERTGILGLQQQFQEQLRATPQTLKVNVPGMGVQEIQGTLGPAGRFEPTQTPLGPAVSPNIPAAQFQAEFGPRGLRGQQLGLEQRRVEATEAGVGLRQQAQTIDRIKEGRQLLEDLQKGGATSKIKKAFETFTGQKKVKAQEMREGLIDTLLKDIETLQLGGQPAQPQQPTPTVNEIRRKTQDGRIAIFDAKTKQFIRFEE